MTSATIRNLAVSFVLAVECNADDWTTKTDERIVKRDEQH